MQVLWVPVGAAPNINKCQDLLHHQLTGAEINSALPAEERLDALRAAMAGKKLLLVLDDIWEQGHEAALNMIDTATDSKVLISSRVRAVLEGSEIVDLVPPSEEEAVQILLRTAGLQAGCAIPPEAREVVQMCNRLPLNLGIAGKLLRDQDLDGASDWSWVVRVLREEFAANGQTRSAEESVIEISLGQIKGAHRDSILALFKSLALLPEDTLCPLEVVRMMYEASNSGIGRPSLLSIRRWLKVLVKRSLILGSVDRPSLHDVISDYVQQQYSAEELKQAHRNMIDLIRSERPAGLGWERSLHDPLSLYATSETGHHLKHAWDLTRDDWAGDAKALSWVDDFPERQDVVPLVAAQVGVDQSRRLWGELVPPWTKKPWNLFLDMRGLD